MSMPSHVILPSLARVMVARMLIRVVLPAPFGPSSPSTPGCSSRLKPRSAQVLPPYTLLTASMESFIRYS
jgi:hypothetical protein